MFNSLKSCEKLTDVSLKSLAGWFKHLQALDKMTLIFSKYIKPKILTYPKTSKLH